MEESKSTSVQLYLRRNYILFIAIKKQVAIYIFISHIFDILLKVPHDEDRPPPYSTYPPPTIWRGYQSELVNTTSSLQYKEDVSRCIYPVTFFDSAKTIIKRCIKHCEKELLILPLPLSILPFSLI